MASLVRKNNTTLIKKSLELGLEYNSIDNSGGQVEDWHSSVIPAAVSNLQWWRQHLQPRILLLEWPPTPHQRHLCPPPYHTRCPPHSPPQHLAGQNNHQSRVYFFRPMTSILKGQSHEILHFFPAH
jgi:hypothetical protein